MAFAERTERVRYPRPAETRPRSRAAAPRRRTDLPQNATPRHDRPPRSRSRVAAHPVAAHYEVQGALHRGGMGEILLAHVVGPDGFNRKCVLKGLLSRLSHDDVSYQLFMREARLMSRLDHPNIVRVFDLPLVNHKPYLAMEYVQGRNFHQVIQRAVRRGEPVPVRVALHVVAEALRGLHFAHLARDENSRHLGIIHRDISPGNILLSYFGEVRVTDFGIAKVKGAAKVTGPRSIRGKARYVAPEQVNGDAASTLSDIYSAGVVLAEALLGEALWERKTVPETLLAIVSEDREKTLDRVLRGKEHFAGLRPALRGALALKPQDRFASALQFAETLESISQSLGPRMTSVELGTYLRKLFNDAKDVPVEDGFGHSGFPIPSFAMDEPEPEPTGSTVVNLDPEWIKFGDTTRMEPEEIAAVLLDDVDEPRAPVLAEVPLSQPMLEIVSSSELEPQPNTGLPQVLLNPAAVKIQAHTLAKAQAFAPEPPSPELLQPLPASVHQEVVPMRPHADPAETLPPTAPAPIPDSSQLLLGILIGGTLAIAGCVVALLIG